MNLANAKVIGFFSMPGTDLLEANPSAYNAAMSRIPAGAGSCAHCGTGIRHHVVIRTEDGRTAFIGTTCAERVGDESIRACIQNRMTSEQLQSHRDEQARKNAEWNRVAAENRARQEAESAARFEILKDIIEGLENQGTEFHSSLASQLRIGKLSDRQASFVAKAIVGRCTKKSEDAWWAVYGRCVNENGQLPEGF